MATRLLALASFALANVSETVARVFDEHIARDAPSTPERILDAIHSSNDVVLVRQATRARAQGARGLMRCAYSHGDANRHANSHRDCDAKSDSYR